MKKQLTFLALLIISLSARSASAGPLENLLNELNSIKKTFESAASGATVKQASPSANQNDSSEDLFGNSGKSTSSAAATSSSKIVEATGVGETLDLAKEDAIRQAVQKAVGSYVSSDLITKNDDVIKDKVINLSAGFVEKTEVISQVKRDDGLFETKIKATVTTNKLKRALEEQQIKTTDLDSDSLFGEAMTKLDTTNSTLDLWKSMFAKFPQAAVKGVLIGKPEIEALANDKVLMTFRVLVSWDERYRDEFINIAKNTGEIVNDGVLGSDSYRYIGLGSPDGYTEKKLLIKDKKLSDQIMSLISTSPNNVSVDLKIKNSAGEIVNTVEGCLSSDYYYTSHANNPFIDRGDVSLYGFTYPGISPGSDKFNGKMQFMKLITDHGMNEDIPLVEKKDQQSFIMIVKKEVSRDEIKDFKAVDVVVSSSCKSFRNY